jgi:Domain of unknown function (DUF4281)
VVSDFDKVRKRAMTPHQWFAIANPLAMLGWIALALALLMPAGAMRMRLASAGGRLVPLLLCAGYVVALVGYWGTSPGGGFGTLDEVATLFRAPGVLLAGWVHYLAFDLFIGRWILDDALARADGTSAARRALLLPVLLLTFLFGPAGLLAWFALRGLAAQAPASSAVR